MDPILDIFGDDAFGVVSLTDSINRMPFIPGRAGALGIWDEEGINTTDVAIEDVQGTIALVPDKKRGAPPSQNVTEKRNLRKLSVPHLPLADTVSADEIQNVRIFGAGSQLQAVQQVVQRKMMRMTTNIDLTIEYQRIAALQGIILDSDGTTVIYNLMTEFNVSQPTQDFVFSNSDTDVLNVLRAVSRKVEANLGAAVYDHIHVFCGETWFDELVSHASVKDSYRYFQATGQNQNPNRDDLRFRGFRFGGFLFEEYRGSVGGVDFVDDHEAIAFPVGVPGMYRTYFAPADYMETVNTQGLPRYAKQEPMRFNRGIELEVQSNPLSICTRPDATCLLTDS